ncbi:hypothetical protein O6H91_11G109100 [Diphasiastrum complanatum]|uniref:Uncharacterized protein n=1 Tax=Diphasiastrum complanatum TaxID=34168 RepID=A0ACC2CCU4_DIPCM|nr:hypothetical protein O6H91_11G109100 [Diphasiastrum complanatum]
MARNSPLQHEVMPDDPFGRISISSSQGKLDLSAPLLCARRYGAFDVADEDLVTRSGAQGNPSVGLGSLRSPGAVPFVWEHSPGKPKAKEITLSILPAIPAPPQVRASSPNISTDPQRLRHVSSDHRDGRTGGEVPVGPFVPKALFQNKNFQGQTEQQTLPGEPGEKRSSLEAHSAACDNSIEEADAFSDAADTFDQNEVTTRATSVISTLHDLNNSVLPVGRTDPHARDFIMRRFLPAAKAMAVESPAASPALSESNIQKKIYHSPLGQPQRCSVPRLPVTDRLANLTDKRVVEDSYEDEESSALSRKACGFFPFRLSAAFKHLLPQSSPARLKTKSKLHFVQFSRRSKVKNLPVLESTGKSSSQDESCESSSSEDEHDNGVNVRYGSQSGRATFIGNGLMNRIMQSPQQLPNEERILRDHVHSYNNGFVSLPSNETKGFLGLPKDVASTLSKKQAYGSGRFKTFTSVSAQAQKPSQNGNIAHYCDSLAKKNIGFGSPSPSEMEFHFGRKLGKDTRLSNVHQSDHSDESDISTPSSDTSSLYGDGSPRATAETGETSTTDAKTDRSGNCDSNLYLHSEIPYSGVKGFSLAPAQEAALELESANDPISDAKFPNRLGGTNYQKLLSQAKFEADSPRDPHQHNEQSHKNKPARVLLPPLPKSPSQSWLWRAAPSPTSASLLGQVTPQVKTPDVGISITKSAKWEAMVKSGNTQAGHLRYSESSLSLSMSIQVLMEDSERHFAIPSSCP